MKLFPFLTKQEYRSTQLPLIAARRRPLRQEPKKGGRKAIFVLFGVCLFLSAAFWLWGNLSEKSQEPILITTVLPTPTKGEAEKREVVDRFQDKTKGLQGEYGFYVYSLVSRYEYGHSQNQVFTAASLIKLPVILALYQEAEAGRINLDEEYRLKNEDKLTGAGSLANKPAGTVLTYKELVHLMCRDSDNTAFGIVRKKLGDERINQTIKNLGMERTSLQRNETTPYEIGLFFKKLYTGGVISRSARDEIIDFLTSTSFEDRIPAGVPEGVKVSHKIGNEAGAFSDAGIVFSSKPFILVVMSKNASQKEATGLISEVSRLVFEAETS